MTIREALDRAEIRYRPYSGRGMMGEYCLGVELDTWGALLEVGVALGAAGVEDIGYPQTDALGRGVIVYWPNIKMEESGDEDGD